MDRSININFGRRVASLRAEKGMSQECLALQSGINRTYIGEIERGEKSPSLNTIAKIASGLNISIKTLFDY